MHPPLTLALLDTSADVGSQLSRCTSQRLITKLESEVAILFKLARTLGARGDVQLQL